MKTKVTERQEKSEKGQKENNVGKSDRKNDTHALTIGADVVDDQPRNDNVEENQRIDYERLARSGADLVDKTSGGCEDMSNKKKM